MRSGSLPERISTPVFVIALANVGFRGIVIAPIEMMKHFDRHGKRSGAMKKINGVATMERPSEDYIKMPMT